MRYHNWPETLAAFLESRRDLPFAWGANDCCLFVADAVEAITGIDAAAPYRGRYSTAAGAYRALKKYGTGAIADAWSAHFTEIPTHEIGRGDVVLFDNAGELASAISFGRKLWAVTDHGLITLPLSHAVRAWRVA